MLYIDVALPPPFHGKVKEKKGSRKKADRHAKK